MRKSAFRGMAALSVALMLGAAPLAAESPDEVALRDWTPPAWEGNPKKRAVSTERRAPASEPTASVTDPPGARPSAPLVEALAPNEPDQADVTFSYYYLAGPSFHARDTATGVDYSGTGCVYTVGGTDRILSAPLILPDGAQIKYLRLFFNDTDATYNVRAYLTRYSGGTSTEDISSTASTGSGGAGTSLSNEITHTVDNFGYGYNLILWPDVSSTTAQVCGARVAYYAPNPGVYTFYSVTPCRVADTRGMGFSGQYGPPALAANTGRAFDLEGQCGIPAEAVAVSVNFTVTQTQGPGDIRTHPKGSSLPLVSTLNYLAGQTIANAAIVPLGGTPKGIAVFPDVSGTHLIIDINGYFAP